MKKNNIYINQSNPIKPRERKLFEKLLRLGISLDSKWSANLPFHHLINYDKIIPICPYGREEGSVNRLHKFAQESIYKYYKNKRLWKRR